MSDKIRVYQKFINIYKKDIKFKQKVINIITKPCSDYFVYFYDMKIGKINEILIELDNGTYSSQEYRIFKSIIDILYNKIKEETASDFLNSKYRDLKDQTIDHFINNRYDMIEWKINDQHNKIEWNVLRRTLYSNIKYTIFDIDSYDVYSSFCEFEWFGNKYTIHVNERNVRENEQVKLLANKLNTIVHTFYNKFKDNKQIIKYNEIIWKGDIVGKDLVIDLSIISGHNIFDDDFSSDDYCDFFSEDF